MSHSAYLVRLPRGAQYDAGVLDVINGILKDGSGRVVELRQEIDGLKVELELTAERGPE